MIITDNRFKFRSIATQWMMNILLVTAALVVVIGTVLCSLIRVIYLDRVKAKAIEYSQDFSTLSMVSPESYYATARDYAENFAYKDKLEIELLDNKGTVLISTNGFLPTETQMPDYTAALESSSGSAYFETETSYGEPILCYTSLLADYGSGSNGAVRWIVSLEQMNSSVLTFRLIIIGVGILIIAITAFSGRLFVRSIVRPIRQVSNAARKIAMGDFATFIDIKKDNEIGELCDSINYMANELKQADTMKNDFISSVSHELRTPLTAIRGWGETAKMSIGTDEEVVAKGLDVVLTESERLSNLVEELLDFSRMQGGRMTMSLEPLAVTPILCETVDMYKELAVQQNISLNFYPPKADSIIMGDKNRLKQVFINIVDNAVKYTESGGQVIIEQTESDGCVRIIVQDTGVGIPAQDIDRVKEKFFKSNKTVRGSGIGLAVADEIILQHSGLLFIESTEGVGTTVTVALPLYENIEEEQAPIEVSPEETQKDGTLNG
ncbi:MAG: HAMP domain-containing histidine kinase [Clostridiales bacterium]|nr:HAMP domain-containing histidine kinase [Candidatus Equinaster intestinalis]